MTVVRIMVALAVLATPSMASAATIVIYADPMTMERRAVVVDPHGPARTILCLLPPATSPCAEVKAVRR